MKKTGYILLIAILLLQCGGVFVFYGLKQSFIKNQMHENLLTAKSDLVNFTFTIAEYQQHKLNKKEISVNGKMYDIRSVSFNGDQVTVIAIHDNDEEHVIEKMTSSLNTSNKQSGNHSQQLVKLFSSIYLHSSFQQLKSSSDFIQISFQPVTENRATHLPEITSPPPRFV